MSMMFYVQDSLPLTRRQAWGRLFGICIEKTREAGGRSVEETAHLAGMESSAWAAIEAGYVPADPTQLRSMAGALECGYERIANLAQVCGDAWEQ
jgi:transcriptional regulator with XRE-family HTH domain